jgi:regulator of replication initiation timing
MEISNYIGLAAGVLSGSLMIKIWEHFFISKKDETEVLMMLVKQLQASVNENNDRVKELQSEVKEWREKYYDAFEEKHSLSLEIKSLKTQLAKFNATMAANNT